MNEQHLDEFRARIKALEERIRELQTIHNTAVDWRMDQDYRLNQLESNQPASPSAERMLALQDQIRDGALTLADAVKEIGSKTTIRTLVVGAPEDQIPSLDVSREQQAHYQAELARLELLRLRGGLVVAPIRSGPESLLVERVADAIAAEDGMRWNYHARAAILEVAAWLHLEIIDWYAADRLEQEANR